MPTAPAMRAARAINTKTDRILRELGLNPGEMTEENHTTTAEIIDREAGILNLIESLEACRPFIAGRSLIARVDAALAKAKGGA
jgi:hypothetical protein